MRAHIRGEYSRESSFSVDTQIWPHASDKTGRDNPTKLVPVSVSSRYNYSFAVSFTFFQKSTVSVGRRICSTLRHVLYIWAQSWWSPHCRVLTVSLHKRQLQYSLGHGWNTVSAASPTTICQTSSCCTLPHILVLCMCAHTDRQNICPSIRPYIYLDTHTCVRHDNTCRGALGALTMPRHTFCQPTYNMYLLTSCNCRQVSDATLILWKRISLN